MKINHRIQLKDGHSSHTNDKEYTETVYSFHDLIFPLTVCFASFCMGFICAAVVFHI